MTSPRRPLSEREPYCKHTYHDEPKQPASMCTTCRDGDELRRWREGWDAWLAANPDSDDARATDEWQAALRLGGYPRPRGVA